MDLKSQLEVQAVAQKRQHLIRRLAKAARHAAELVALTAARCDARTQVRAEGQLRLHLRCAAPAACSLPGSRHPHTPCMPSPLQLEAEAYGLWMAGSVLLEKESDWEGALARFLKARCGRWRAAGGGRRGGAASAVLPSAPSLGSSQTLGRHSATPRPTPCCRKLFEELAKVGSFEQQAVCKHFLDQVEPTIRCAALRCAVWVWWSVVCAGHVGAGRCCAAAGWRRCMLTPGPALHLHPPRPPGRYCQYQVGRKGGAAPDAAALLETIGGGGSDQLQSKLASLAAETRAAQAVSTSSLSWSGETYAVRDETIRIPLHTAQVGGWPRWGARGGRRCQGSPWWLGAPLAPAVCPWPAPSAHLPLARPLGPRCPP